MEFTCEFELQVFCFRRKLLVGRSVDEEPCVDFKAGLNAAGKREILAGNLAPLFPVCSHSVYPVGILDFCVGFTLPKREAGSKVSRLGACLFGG
jgi:hypothetical protein